MGAQIKKGGVGNLVDDGFNAKLVEGAVFTGRLEFPLIKKPERFIILNEMVPFSKRKQVDSAGKILMFYEYDVLFRRFILDPGAYLEEIRRFEVVVSPDCSLYRDMPLCLQIINTYLNRQIGHYLQSMGLYVVPNVRWGDERSYLRTLPDEPPFAFLGVEKHSIVSIGTYGCCRGNENRHHLREGLRAMLKELEPEIVLVYGAMPPSVFDEFSGQTRFIHYPDWTSVRHGRG